MTSKLKPAVVLLSGGLDSATCLAICKDRGFVPYAISFRYGQRHAIELEKQPPLRSMQVLQSTLLSISTWERSAEVL